MGRNNQNSKWATHQQVSALRRNAKAQILPVEQPKEEVKQIPVPPVEVVTEPELEPLKEIVEEVEIVPPAEVKPLVKKGKNKE